MKRVREDEPVLDPTVRDQIAALYVFKACQRDHLLRCVEIRERRRLEYLNLVAEAAAAACGC